MKHVTVFQAPHLYAGWPANHGSWQWGDEFLVGFLVGQHYVGGMHNVVGPLTKLQARSLDGGETWTMETPNVDFEARKPTPPPSFNLNRSIIRVCGRYDHGGEKCADYGGFYLSHDKGKVWEGPFYFEGIKLAEYQKNTSRTCVLGSLVFLSACAKRHWGADFTFCARHDGYGFVGQSIVLDDTARAVMPAAASVKNRIVVAMRRRGHDRPGGWVDSVFSDDGGMTWTTPRHVGETGKDNGNPPALIEHNERLYCAFANRSEGCIDVMESEDGAYSWHGYKQLRKGPAPDIGYPRLFKRSDGQLVCVYYWTDDFELPQRIEATIFEAR